MAVYPYTLRDSSVREEIPYREEINRICHRYPVQTEESQTEGKQIMP